VTTPNGSSRSTKWQMAHNERIIQGLLNVRTLLECISAIQDSKEIGVLTPKFQVSRFCAEKTLTLLLVLKRAAESEQIDIF
jgi:glutamine synthetase type III